MLAVAALLICLLGWLLLWRREPWATVQFAKAQFSNDSVTFDYVCRVSPGAFLHATEFRDGLATADSADGGRSRFGWPTSGGGQMSFGFSPSEMAALPSLLVETGRNYIVKLHDQLSIYDFTNKSGARYQGRFWVEQVQ